MIIGLGNDLVDIRRIEKSLETFGKKISPMNFADAVQENWITLWRMTDMKAMMSTTLMTLRFRLLLKVSARNSLNAFTMKLIKR